MEEGEELRMHWWKVRRANLVCVSAVVGNCRHIFLSGYCSLREHLHHCLSSSRDLLVARSGTDARKLGKTAKPGPGSLKSLEGEQIMITSWLSLLTSALPSFTQDYELEAEKLRSLLDLENGRNSHVNKRARLQSPAAKVKEEVSCK